MLLSHYKLLLIIFVIKVNAENIVSNEESVHDTRREKNTYNRVERRFIDNLDDETWHISHLKDTDFGARRSNCEEDTFEEKVKKYRKSLQSDGALVEYVSADTLPFDKKDLVAEVCKAPDKKDLFNSVTSPKDNASSSRQEVPTERNKSDMPKDELKTADAKINNNTKVEHEKLNVATTTTEETNSNKSTEKPPDARRASEYLFSSVEYYDETFDFNSNICPDAVEEIILQIDHIRNYDVKCEQILEWRSLE